MTVDNLGRIRFHPINANVGVNPVKLTVSDSRGGKVVQEFDLAVLADLKAPQVELYIAENPVSVGDIATFFVNATDNVAVKDLSLKVNGVGVAIDTNGVASVKMNSVGDFSAVIKATDAAGNIGQQNLPFSVLNFGDVDAPEISLNLTSDTVFTSPTAISGTITDTNLLYYKVEVRETSSGEWKEIARKNDPVVNGVLTEFDPSLLSNDAYDLRFSAYDAGGNITYATRTVNVTGDLKLGNFQLSFNDLAIPVTGIPINLTRTYDTLTASQKDDFGYGWRLEFRDTDLRTSIGKDEGLETLGVRSVGFSEKTKVYITLPGGKRESFTFKAKDYNPLINAFLNSVSNGGNGDPSLYVPSFVPEAGNTSTLSVESALIVRGANNQFYGASGGAYNPADKDYGFGGYYLLTTKEGIKYRINATTGDLDTITDTNGNVLTFSDGGISSSSGVKVTFERDAEGKIREVIDPSGSRIKYDYDSNGDLVAVTDRNGNKTRFEYNTQQAHYLDKIIDPLGREGIKTQYNPDGRLSRVIDVEGKAVELVYEPANSLQTVKDQLGNPATFEYDERGNIVTEIDAVGKITKRQYDSNNNTIKETVISDRSGSAGFTTEYTYDAQNNLLSEKDPNGHVTNYTYGNLNRLLTTTDPLKRTTTNAYDNRGNLLFSTDAEGNVTKYSYDLKGDLLSVTDPKQQATNLSYDSRGNVILVTDVDNNITTFTYDDNGNKLTETKKVTTPTGVKDVVTKWTYDDNGKVKTITDALNNTTTYEYNELGQQIAIIDPLSRRTEYRYDERGTLIETIYPDNTPSDSSDNPRTSSSYDAAGNQTASIDEAGRVTRYVYDKVGRVVETILPDGTPNNQADNPRNRTEYYKDGLVKADIDERNNRTEYFYDAAGQQTLEKDALGNETRSLYDAAGQQIAITDALGHTTRFNYDVLGRNYQTIFPNQTYTTNTYDTLGRRIATTDAAGNTTDYRYNALGQLTGVQNSAGDWTEYDYNEMGNLISVKDAKQHITKYEYDLLGRRTATILPLGQRSLTTYDAVGNVISQKDFNGDTITFSYDARNRLMGKYFPDNTNTLFTYTPTGQRKTVVDDRGTTLYNYDEQYRLISRTDPDGKTISYTYDLSGNRTSVTVPSGTTNYTFDALNRLDKVTDPAAKVTDYEYDGIGNLVSTTFSNGVVETREYDDLNRLIYLENKKGSGSVISSYRYTLDPVGNRLKVVENSGRMVQYTYDNLYRLTKEDITDSVNGNRSLSYIYDKVGNRLTLVDSEKGTTLYNYDANDRLLTHTVGGVVTNYLYDNNGNTNSRTNSTEQTNYDWDYQNRLISATTTTSSGTKQMQYQYDADGIRVASSVNGVKTKYLIDTNQPFAQVLEEYNSNGQVQVFYVYGNDLISQQRGSDLTFYLVDGLGSTRVLTDGSGNVASTYTYEAFGELISDTGNVENKYRFAGEQFDEGLGDYYLRSRYYDQNTGRFTRQDSYEGSFNNPSSLHKYLYGNANPVNFTDPSGFTPNLQEILVGLSIADTLLNAAQFILNPTPVNLAFLLLGAIDFPLPFNNGLKTIFGGQGKALNITQMAESSMTTNAIEDSARFARTWIQTNLAGYKLYFSDNSLTLLSKSLAKQKISINGRNAKDFKRVDWIGHQINDESSLLLVEAKTVINSDVLHHSLEIGPSKFEDTLTILNYVNHKGGGPELKADRLIMTYDYYNSQKMGDWSIGLQDKLLYKNGALFKVKGKPIEMRTVF